MALGILALDYLPTLPSLKEAPLMIRRLIPSALGFLALALPVHAEGLTGKYVEARTCDVWTGPCFANAEMNLAGKHAVLGWKVEQGSLDNVRLDGLSVVAVVAASDTLGLEQTGPAKAILIVDQRANACQRDALVRLAQQEGGKLVQNLLAVQTAPVDLDIIPCQDGGCATLRAGNARVETRCLDAHHDKVCGNESAFYPPLSKGVSARATLAVEHSFTGKAFNETWKDSQRRGAYVGSFELH
jgi:hypothetical protein